MQTRADRRDLGVQPESLRGAGKAGTPLALRTASGLRRLRRRSFFFSFFLMQESPEQDESLPEDGTEALLLAKIRELECSIAEERAAAEKARGLQTLYERSLKGTEGAK